RSARRKVGSRRMRDHRRQRQSGLRDSYGVSVAPLHVRHQPCDQRCIRSGHVGRPDPRRDAARGDRQAHPPAQGSELNMSNTIEQIANQEYKYGFVTDIEADVVAPGLNEDIVRIISAKKEEPEWLL